MVNFETVNLWTTLRANRDVWINTDIKINDIRTNTFWLAQFSKLSIPCLSLLPNCLSLWGSLAGRRAPALRSVKESSTSSIKDDARRERGKWGKWERTTNGEREMLWCYNSWPVVLFSKLTSLLFNSVYCHWVTRSAKRAHHSVISVNQALEWMYLHLACFRFSCDF